LLSLLPLSSFYNPRGTKWPQILSIVHLLLARPEINLGSKNHVLFFSLVTLLF
jgi:hypothetical protein